MAVSTVTLKDIQKAIWDFEKRTGKKASSITLNLLTLVNLETTVGHVAVWGIRVNQKKDCYELFRLPVVTPKRFNRNKLLIS